MDPINKIGNEVRVYTQASEAERLARLDAPAGDEAPPPTDEKAEVQRQAELKADAEAQAERDRQRHLEGAPMNWESGRRLDRYA